MPAENTASAIAAYQEAQGIASAFRQMRSQVNDYLERFENEAYGTLWQSLETAPQATDGSLEANSPDSTPNPDHPIITGSLGRSANQAIAFVNLLKDLQSMMNGQAITTADRNQVLDDFAS